MPDTNLQTVQESPEYMTADERAHFLTDFGVYLLHRCDSDSWYPVTPSLEQDMQKYPQGIHDEAIMAFSAAISIAGIQPAVRSNSAWFSVCVDELLWVLSAVRKHDAAVLVIESLLVHSFEKSENWKSPFVEEIKPKEQSHREVIRCICICISFSLEMGLFCSNISLPVFGHNPQIRLALSHAANGNIPKACQLLQLNIEENDESWVFYQLLSSLAELSDQQPFLIHRAAEASNRQASKALDLFERTLSSGAQSLKSATDSQGGAHQSIEEDRDLVKSSNVLKLVKARDFSKVSDLQFALC